LKEKRRTTWDAALIKLQYRFAFAFAFAGNIDGIYIMQIYYIKKYICNVEMNFNMKYLL